MKTKLTKSEKAFMAKYSIFQVKENEHIYDVLLRGEHLFYLKKMGPCKWGPIARTCEMPEFTRSTINEAMLDALLEYI